LALFVALSGVTYAANTPKNSVSSSIKKGAVRSSDVAKNTLTGADVNEAKLGEVPSATSASQLDGLDSSAFVLDTDSAGGDLTGVFSGLEIASGAVSENELSSTALRPQQVAPNGAQGVTAVLPIVFLFSIDNGNDVSRLVPKNLIVVDAWTLGKTTDPGTVTVEGPSDAGITEAIDPTDGAIVRAGTIDQSNYGLSAGQLLTADASNAMVDTQVVVLAVPNIAG
jgi:hypothetical protein